MIGEIKMSFRGKNILNRIGCCMLASCMLLPFGALNARAEEQDPVLPMTITGEFFAKLVKDAVEADSDDAMLQQLIFMDRQEWEQTHVLVINSGRTFVEMKESAADDSLTVGKFYGHAVGELMSVQKDWYEIRSGNVSGYVRRENCLTGQAALDMAREVGHHFAKVTSEGLFLRAEAQADAQIIGMLPHDEEVTVLDVSKEWIKIECEAGKGYVQKQYVELYSEFVYAESLKEERERKARESQERRAAVDAANQYWNTVSYAVDPASVTFEDEQAMGTEVVKYALNFVGNPYEWGGTSLTNGTDCSGFVKGVYEAFGVELPHSSTDDRSKGYAVASLEEALPGDIICYSGHVAIYAGDGLIVHASGEEAGIIVSAVDYRDIVAIRRIF